MALVENSNGQNKLLAIALGLAAAESQTIHLFVNNITPGHGDVVSTYTEMSSLGYGSKALTSASWVVTQVSGSAQGSYATQTWTFTAGTAVTVYGYYVTSNSTNTLLWAEQFATPITVQYSGDQIAITPTITLT